ncbi:HAD family hydrolase [Polaromonas aquatica]|uniref:HAD family hydrolase n=1 Tax=Polaromonas aquatica TaxID=332657 RepID=UPI003D65718F
MSFISLAKISECFVAIENILFDADGVLQYATRHWQPALQSILKLEDETQAKAVLADVFEAETEVLEAEGGFAERLDAVLSKWGRSGFLSEALSVIHAIEIHQDVMQSVQSIRRSGIRCHVGSNQQTSRAKHMSEGLNYRSLFDTEFYSCVVGVAKPKVAFFEKVVAQLGCDASAVLFLDDRAENVKAAKQAGLNAMVFFGSNGASELQRQLAGFGVIVDH